jgi:hypothetical protein
MSDPQPRPNRRTSSRKPPRGRVRLSCYRGATDLGVNLALALMEVSETGVRLALQAALDPGQEVTLLLEGQGHSRPVRIQGNVIWCTPRPEGGFLTGIRFQKYLAWPDLQNIV